MRSNFYLTIGALATLAAADNPNAFNIPKGGYQFEVGEPTTLKWNPTTDGTVSLKLQSGEVSTPESGSTIASHIDNSGSYTWTPSDDIENSGYTIEIIDDSDSAESNYLPSFSVSGATASASASSSSSASSTASSSASTSSESSTTASASTMTTMTNTTSSPSTTASTTTGASSTTSNTSSTSAESSSSTPSASSSAAASSSSAAAATASDTSAGMINRVSGSMMAIVLGAIALI